MRYEPVLEEKETKLTTLSSNSVGDTTATSTSTSSTSEMVISSQSVVTTSSASVISRSNKSIIGITSLYQKSNFTFGLELNPVATEKSKIISQVNGNGNSGSQVNSHVGSNVVIGVLPLSGFGIPVDPVG